MSTRLAILSLLLASSSALAHCQLAWPYPLHSPINPATPETIKDYSMTSPLVTDGTYPCKGFINTPSSGMESVQTYSAGSTMNYTVAGTATHGGGSCQISMSYDLGATWSVIFSYIGGCMVEGMTTSLTVPSDAPNGEALFSWSWFNLLGNREMYQNCAVVTITDGGAGLGADKYPTPFVANAGVNQCVTIENTAVVFPNPGANVRYGRSYASTKPTTPAGFTGTNCVGPGASSSGASNSTSSSTSTSPSSSTISSSSTTSTASATSSTLSASSTAPSPSSDATDPLIATTARTTLWTVPSTNSSSIVSAEDVGPSSSSTASTASATQCTRRRKRSKAQRSAGLERRHERLVRRRVAASKAEHISVRSP